MRALVTGGSGFLGGHIVQELEKTNATVVIFDKKPPSFKTRAEFVEADITAAIPLSPNDFGIVFHAAGSLGTDTTFDRVLETFSVNVMGMITLMNWLSSGEQRPRIINCGLIRDWLNPYMVSKHTASKIGGMYAEVFGIPFLDVRMTVVYGPRQGWKEQKVVPRFVLRALVSEPLPIYGQGDSLMNMMYVKDVARLLVALSNIDDLFGVKSPRRIDLANPLGDISVIEFAKAVLSKTNRPGSLHCQIEYKDMRRGQPGCVGLDYDLRGILKYIPNLESRFRSLSDGLDETISWYGGLI
ncbi:MAG: NAD-dependent epimerase/dehydratase family protein [Planctomycetota bacterium]|jgi:UDP-glucose 4-epimerase